MVGAMFHSTRNLFFFAVLSAVGALAAPPAPANSSAAVLQKFPNPPAEFRTAPFFVWDYEITEAMIDRNLEDFKAQGIGAVIIHPRPGLITEYLSDRWFQLVRYTVERAKKLGMLVWLYDENSYPSGFAGGHVPAEMPESWNQGQGLIMRKLDHFPADSKVCEVLLRRDGDSFAEPTAGSSNETGEFYCFEKAFYPKSGWTGGFSYVDLIRPGVTQKFIDITMSGYERAIGAEFGKTVQGIFTDEPNINPPGRSLRWTPDLFEQFSKRWGYDLKTNLVSLYEPVGDWRKVRHNYYALLLELFIDRWSKPWHAYTEAKGLSWTGHYWEHGWPSPAEGPDNMAMYAFHQVPAVDMLAGQSSEGVGAQFGNVRSIKELASAANQTGRVRRLSESYGGAGWQIPFEDLKRLGDWECALGVNLINQHLSRITLTGARKYDYPPFFDYHEPWWNHYRTLVDYFGRLSMALSTGEERNRTLIIEPTTTAWLYAAGRKSDPLMMRNGSAFQAFVTRLQWEQGEYDLGSENMMKDLGRVTGPRLTVGQRTYDLMVLAPGTENLDSPTVKLLADYLKGGGRVLAFVDPPARLDGGVSDRVAKLAAQYAAQWRRADSLDDPGARKALISDEFRKVEGRMVHQRHELSDGELLFFANSSGTAPLHAEIAIRAGSLMQLDLANGKIAPYPGRKEGSRTVFNVDLAENGSLLLLASKTGKPAAAPPVRKERLVASAGQVKVERLTPNTIQIDYCDLNLGGAVEPDLHFYNAGEHVWKHHGWDTNPWNAQVQYKTSILDKGKFAADSGYEATFWFEMEGAVDRTGLQAVVERPGLFKVAVNGKPVEPRPNAWRLDREFGVYDIGELARAGRNSITVKASPMTIHSELEPVYVVGNFGVAAQEKGWKLVPAAPLGLGSWKDQNLPFYSDTVSYSRGYRLKRGGRYTVRLAQWKGTLVEVKVNGKSAGVIGWQPYELEVGKFVKDGENRIDVVVYGSRKNLYGPHYVKLGLGLVGPGEFRVAPSHMPPGASYDLDSYGLMEDFTVVER